MKIEEITMTPALATTLLEGNTGNRRLDPRRVKSLVAAFTAGEYKFEGSPIRIGPGGLVLDGQHRMEAVRASGVSIQVLLITDLDPSVQLVLDTGKPRTFVDFLTVHGVSNATNVAATTALFWHYEQGHVVSPSSWSYRPTPTYTELWGFYQDHEDEIRSAIKETHPVRRKIRIAPSVAAAGYMILAGVDEEDAEAFFSELRFEVAQGAPAALLARTLNARRERSMRDYNQQEQMALLFKTWNMYRSNSIVEKLAWMQSPKKKERFPLPV
jgi:hypothetical protein